MRVTSDGSVGVPINWKGLPGHEEVPFDTAFPFVANAPQIDPVPVMERAVIVDGAFPDVPLKACSNPGAPKIQKADDDSPTPRKRKASNDDDSGPKTVRRSRRGDGDGPIGIGGIGIIIGGGIGGLEGTTTAVTATRYRLAYCRFAASRLTA